MASLGGSLVEPSWGLLEHAGSHLELSYASLEGHLGPSWTLQRSAPPSPDPAGDRVGRGIQLPTHPQAV
eukprot:5048659-Pyramimonas_sp.AAC.1